MTGLRHRPARDLLRLVEMLQARRHVGMTIEEIAHDVGRSERTVHRLLKTLADTGYDLHSRLDEDGRRKRWMVRTSRSTVPAVTADTLSSLTGIGEMLRSQGLVDYAELITDLRRHLEASQERRRLLALDPDLEVFDDTLGVASRPGPVAPSDPTVRRRLQDAIVTGLMVHFTYTDVRGDKTSERLVSPLGLLLGPRAYLVARDTNKSVRIFALTGIREPRLMPDVADRDDFDLRAFVERSFGAFHDGVYREWRLRFEAAARHEVEHYRFHPSQTVTVHETGEVEVVFTCESVREVAYECFRWSEWLVAVETEELRACLREICERIMRAAGDG